VNWKELGKEDKSCVKMEGKRERGYEVCEKGGRERGEELCTLKCKVNGKEGRTG
jgi:hypothetical protein